METDIAYVNTRMLAVSSNPTMAISVNLPNHRMFSGIQLIYDTDYNITNTSIVGNVRISIHENRNIVIILNQSLSSGDFIYMSLRNGTYFRINSYIVGNDRFPYRKYL